MTKRTRFGLLIAIPVIGAASFLIYATTTSGLVSMSSDKTAKMHIQATMNGDNYDLTATIDGSGGLHVIDAKKK
jgi:hypothetical protein